MRPRQKRSEDVAALFRLPFEQAPLDLQGYSGPNRSSRLASGPDFRLKKAAFPRLGAKCPNRKIWAAGGPRRPGPILEPEVNN
jgi:hypothetical protein